MIYYVMFMGCGTSGPDQKFESRISTKLSETLLPNCKAPDIRAMRIKDIVISMMGNGCCNPVCRHCALDYASSEQVRETDRVI